MCCAGFWFIIAVMLMFAAALDCRDALACDVTDCGFGPECGLALAEVLKTNTTLKYLNCRSECAVLQLRGFIVAIACSVLGSLLLTRLRSDNEFCPVFEKFFDDLVACNAQSVLLLLAACMPLHV